MSLVALITDFGSTDYYVALLKASILKETQDVQFIDVNHGISPHDIMEGAFYLKSVYKRFPKGTIHVVHVNSFYSSNQSLIVFEYDNYFFLGPNNGLFSLVFDDLIEEDIVALQMPESEQLDIYQLTGRAIRHLDERKPLEELGVNPDHFDKKINLQPVVTTHQIRATIIHVDHFGNVIVNLDRFTFNKIRAGREYTIYYKSKEPISKICQSYSDVPVGDVCATFTSTGLLELAVNMGNANKLLSLNKNETIQINFF